MDFDFPVLDAAIDNLKAGHHALGGGQYIGSGDAGAFEGFLQHKGNFAFGFGLNQGFGLNRFALVEDHAIGQPAKVGLEYAQHVHYGLAGHADFFAHNFLTCGQATRQHFLLDGVGIFNGDIGVAVG